MNVLVTGASGFSGAAVTRRLVMAGHAVTALHRRSSSFFTGLQALHGVTFVRGDLADAGLLPGPFDAVVHAAATSPAEGVDVSRIVKDNVAGTAALIDAAVHWGSHTFILYSSLSVYGVISTPVVDERTPVVDPDAYGESKHLCERMLEERAPVLPGIALRLPGILGPGAHRNWMSGVAARLMAGEPVHAYHANRPFNNAAHVSDVSEFVLRLLSKQWDGFDAVVLGARGEISVRCAIERLAAGLQVEPVIQYSDPAKPSFTIRSDRAITRWGYAPMEIGSMIDQYAADVLTSHRGA